MTNADQALLKLLAGRVVLVGNATPDFNLSVLVEEFDTVVRINDGHNRPSTLVGRRTDVAIVRHPKALELRTWDGVCPVFLMGGAIRNTPHPELTNVLHTNLLTAGTLMVGWMEAHFRGDWKCAAFSSGGARKPWTHPAYKAEEDFEIQLMERLHKERRFVPGGLTRWS